MGSNPNITYFLEESQISVTVTPSTGEVAYTLNLQGQEVTRDPNDNSTVISETITPLGTYSGSDNFNGEAQGFLGLNINDSGAVIGDFTGWFFGPQGAEIGIVISGQTQLQDSTELDFSLAFGGPQD